MTFAPNDIIMSITGSQDPVLHSADPTDLSDYANPTITDPTVAAKFLFENILLTNPGEKLSDPKFGIGLKSFLFEPHTNLLDLQSIVEGQLKSYAVGISILDVSVDFTGVDSNSISIRIKYLNPDKTINNYLLNTELGNSNMAIYT
jgi:phage baseplate assembly protein W